MLVGYQRGLKKQTQQALSFYNLTATGQPGFLMVRVIVIWKMPGRLRQPG